MSDLTPATLDGLRLQAEGPLAAIVVERGDLLALLDAIKELTDEMHSRELHHFESEVMVDELQARIDEALALEHKPGAHKEHLIAALTTPTNPTPDQVRARVASQVERGTRPTPYSTNPTKEQEA